MKTRSTSKLINVINEDSDQNSKQTTEEGSVSEKDINPINSKHWKAPYKLYYKRRNPRMMHMRKAQHGDVYSTAISTNKYKQRGT